MREYLIPANTKKGQLIMGMFRPSDLILFAIGIVLTIILAVVLPIASSVMAFMALLPALVTGFLVIPIPNYHNMLVVVSELISFFMNQRNFLWKGWCVRVGYKNDNGK